jgi:hypothetical protein
MRKSEMSRAAIVVGGVTLGSLVALLIRAGWRDRRIGDAASPLPLIASPGSRPGAPVPEPIREDVLERLRLAAAV